MPCGFDLSVASIHRDHPINQNFGININQDPRLQCPFHLESQLSYIDGRFLRVWQRQGLIQIWKSASMRTCAIPQRSESLALSTLRSRRLAETSAETTEGR